jgi:hypothetical protein
MVLTHKVDLLSLEGWTYHSVFSILGFNYSHLMVYTYCSQEKLITLKSHYLCMLTIQDFRFPYPFLQKVMSPYMIISF